MLDLKDFFHLPQVDTLFGQLVVDEPGLIIVAGLDPLAAQAAEGGPLPGGRATILRILMRQLIAARQLANVIVVAENKNLIRLPRYATRKRQGECWINWMQVGSTQDYADRIMYAARRKPDLLVIDRLDARSAQAALEAARRGQLVLSQFDTVFSGAGVARHLLDLGMRHDLLDSLSWIVTVQRLPALCSRCKQPVEPEADCLAELRRRCSAAPFEGSFFQAAGCTSCNDSGREGDLTVFDIFRAGSDLAASLRRVPYDDQPSLLPLEDYVIHLAAQGCVALQDALGFQADQLRRTYNLFAASERALAESNAALQRKLAQIEAANLVMEQRTEALISLQGISRTLVASTSLTDVASRVCRHSHDLCGADLAILYFFQPDGTAEVLAVNGWDQALVHQRLDAMRVMASGEKAAIASGPVSFSGLPPGVPLEYVDKDNAWLRAGLRVPLVAQQEVVGLMIVHSTQKPDFAPGEVALLQAFVDQAAVALQRAGLIDALRDKIAQLEAAQAELLEKEFIKDTFGRVVDPRVRDYYLSGHVDLGGQVKEATILFVDIRGFTPLSEKMRPDRVVSLLNRYFEKMSRCVAEEDGLVNRYIGDAILAIFGAPISLENHADAAVRAALKMRVARDALNIELEQEGLPIIRTGVGIHTGPVLAGNIGSSTRMEYTVIGDTVNLASRIEKLCKEFPHDIILSEATASRLSAALAPNPLATVKVPGKEQSIQVFCL